MNREKENEAETSTLRADARRNHDLLIDAAAETFADVGIDAPIKEIAARAGVGVGTLYRRFPKRSDLIIAVFRREVEACADAAETLAQTHPAAQAFRLWIDRYVDLIVTKRGLSAAFHSGDPAYDGLAEYFEKRLTPALQRLLESLGGQATTIIPANDLLRAVALLCTPAAAGERSKTARMVALLLNGLTAGVAPYGAELDPGQPTKTVAS